MSDTPNVANCGSTLNEPILDQVSLNNGMLSCVYNACKKRKEKQTYVLNYQCEFKLVGHILYKSFLDIGECNKLTKYN